MSIGDLCTKNNTQWDSFDTLSDLSFHCCNYKAYKHKDMKYDTHYAALPCICALFYEKSALAHSTQVLLMLGCKTDSQHHVMVCFWKRLLFFHPFVQYSQNDIISAIATCWLEYFIS